MRVTCKVCGESYERDELFEPEALAEAKEVWGLDDVGPENVCCEPCFEKILVWFDAQPQSPAPGVFLPGQLVAITFGDRRVAGVVLLVGRHGKPMMLETDAMLGGSVGQLAVTWEGEPGAEQGFDLFSRTPVSVEPQKRPRPR